MFAKLMTTRTLFENFEGFSQILKEQSGKKGFWVCLDIHKQKFKNLKTAVSKEKFGCPRSNIFAKTKKFAKPFLPVHMGPRSNLLSKKKMVKNLVTLSL